MNGVHDEKVRGAQDEAAPEAGAALPIYLSNLDDLLTFFARPNLTVPQAEELLSHVHKAQPELVGRLLCWLEDLEHADGPAGRRDAGATNLPGTAGEPQDVALVLLTYLGDQAIVPRLRALVRNTDASDEFKLKLISVIHDLEPQQDTQVLLDHLRYPSKAILQSHRKHLQRLASPLERSFWLELMVDEMSADARISFAHSSAEVDDLAAVPVLACMCYDPDAEVALAAIDAVERYKDARTLPILQELARHHLDEGVREEAQKAADRLSVRVPLSPQVEPAPPDPLLACYLTTIDGEGEQAAVFVRRLPAGSAELDGSPGTAEPYDDEFLRLAQVAFNDQNGIEQCFGLDLHVDDLERVLDELEEHGLVPVQVPYEQALAQLDEACQWTWRAGEILPLSFVAWREWIYGPLVVPLPEPALPPAPRLDGRTSRRRREWLYIHCHELLYQDEFADWHFGVPVVDELGADYMRLVESYGEPLAPDVLRALLRRGVEQIVHPYLRRQLQARLYRVAPLLRELYEEDRVWQWAVVAADELSAESAYPILEHPLLLGLVGHSLQFALDRDLDWTIAL